jgi:hypothetical protein
MLSILRAGTRVLRSSHLAVSSDREPVRPYSQGLELQCSSKSPIYSSSNCQLQQYWHCRLVQPAANLADKQQSRAAY